jgi:hypothetical protein
MLSMTLEYIPASCDYTKMGPTTSPQGPGGPHLDRLELHENNDGGYYTEM